MASLTDLREALASNLSAITGLNESAYFRSNPTPPACEVTPGEITYDEAMQRGLDEWEFMVRVFVGVPNDIAAQKRLDSMMASSGTASIKAALESDPTLGGHAQDLHVTRCSGYRVYGPETGPVALGAEWTVRVFADGD